jgi:hypothetical protein
MDDQGHPSRWWARLLFEPRQLDTQEWWLGLTVIAIVLGAGWLIFWPYLPGLLMSIFTGIFDGVSWIAGLFSGGGSNQAVAPAAPAGPTILPSPSPSPIGSPSPSPIPR